MPQPSIHSGYSTIGRRSRRSAPRNPFGPATVGANLQVGPPSAQCVRVGLFQEQWQAGRIVSLTVARFSRSLAGSPVCPLPSTLEFFSYSGILPPPAFIE